MLELRDLQLIGNNSYDQIRATLISMMKWDDVLRSRIGVMNYIHQRTRISRSVVAEVLAALRKGGYIEMNKGKLVSINRLPLSINSGCGNNLRFVPAQLYNQIVDTVTHIGKTG